MGLPLMAIFRVECYIQIEADSEEEANQKAVEFCKRHNENCIQPFGGELAWMRQYLPPGDPRRVEPE